MWRGSGSGELGSIVCQRAAGSSPLNCRSGMFPAADSPSAPTRVGAKRGRGRARAWGQSPSRRRTAAGNTPSCFCTGKLSRSWYFSPGSQAPVWAPPAQGAPEGSPDGGGGTWAHLPEAGGTQSPADGQGSLQQSSPPCPSRKALPSGALRAGITSTTPPGAETRAQTSPEGLPLHQLPASDVQGEREGRPGHHGVKLSPFLPT